MSYSDFTLKKVKSEFSLTTYENISLFSTLQRVEISDYLTKTLQRNVPLALSINTEKARSELIIINILLEIKEISIHEISLFSGVDFTVDKERGLNGYCDYIISGTSEQFYVETPVICIVEAKNENIVSGLGQCIAEMVASKLYNEQENTPLSCLYGAVTIGDEWKFIKLEADKVYIDKDTYYINDIGKIIAILLKMVAV